MAGRWQRLRDWLNRRRPLPETNLAISRAWLLTGAALTLAVLITVGVNSDGLAGWLGSIAIVGLLLLAALGIWLALLLLSRLSGAMRGGLLLLAVPLVPVTLFMPRSAPA